MNRGERVEHHNAWRVVCLCAQWCGACREWRLPFDRLTGAYPRLRFTWVDIEDQADTVGELDIETFPTLLIAHGSEPRFYGPVQPVRTQIERLLGSLLAEGTQAVPPPLEAKSLLDRLISNGLLN